ncbi:MULTISPECIES: DUF305 domain-containing protein [Mycolicibacterium]|uniref:DUF305 domain-containing protein n=1 Tax=Mycolicibacterium TaxID=1866885 RepID=UPI0023BA3E86|nr:MULTISPECIES: DUF305 domain-containing protein [Mycolicibacterium]MDW5609380.1 DUF305 domain-containing protein [Mycolicibacterium sp. D5.8-2]
MRQKRTVAVGAAAVAVAAVIASCGNTAGNEASSTASPAPAQTSAATPAASHNQADMMFTRHMIPHHQQAIEMSDIIIAKQGIDPRVVDLAEQIKSAQGPEIEQMQGWLDEWGMPGNMPPGHGDMPGGPIMPGMPGMDGMPGMEGMMSPADMQALQNAQGVEASKLFLSQMIRHHEGAITMAENEIKNGQSPDVVELAKTIASSQRTEIDTMNEILKSL